MHGRIFLNRLAGPGVDIVSVVPLLNHPGKIIPVSENRTRSCNIGIQVMERSLLPSHTYA